MCGKHKESLPQLAGILRDFLVAWFCSTGDGSYTACQMSVRDRVKLSLVELETINQSATLAAEEGIDFW